MHIIKSYIKYIAAILIILCPLGCTGAASGLAANGAAARAARAERVIPTAARRDDGIHWMAWGPEAFERAKSEDRLVFLDISASWCHWCRVMEETAYADPRVAEAINGGFVPVYVDTDARPDVNDRYNQGGWPSIALLTPEGRVVAGRTTVSADQLLVMLSTTEHAYRTDKDGVYARLDRADNAATGDAAPEAGGRSVVLGPEMPKKTLEAVNLYVDPVNGGYGGPEKFPMPDTLEFGLYEYAKTGDDDARRALVLTLDGMAAGLMDGVEGGFFRYSTTPDWRSPHFEKLLSVNGGLLGVYMDAWRVLGEARYRLVAEAIAMYLEDTLYDPGAGAFFNSQAADESYYGLSLDERVEASVPPVDRVLYADSNAVAALGYLSAYRATGDARYMGIALGVMERLKKSLYKAGEGVLHSPGAGADVLHLSDHVYTASAALQTYQATGDAAWLDLAEDVAGVMGKRFGAEGGGFYGTAYTDSPAGQPPAGKRPQAGNCRAAALLMDLRHVTGKEAYEEEAVKTLGVFAPDYQQYGYRAAAFALGVERSLQTAYEFLVIGPPGEAGTRELIRMGYTYNDPDRVVVYLDPVKDGARLDELGYEYDGKPIMYVCSEKACFPPVFPGGSLDKTREYIKRARQQEEDSR